MNRKTSSFFNVFNIVFIIVFIQFFYPGQCGVQARNQYAADANSIPRAELLLRIDESLVKTEAEAYLAAQGLAAIQYLPEIGVWRVLAPSIQAAPGLMASLQEDSTVIDWVEPNGEVRASGWFPTDPYFAAKQSHLIGLGFPEAWSFTQGEGVTIAILDSGVSLTHPDLSTQLWNNPLETPDNAIDDDNNGLVDDVQGWDYVSHDALPQDDFGHGSHVAGIAAASTNNGAGIAGAAGQAKILPVKVLNSRGTGYWDDIAEGIIYAANRGAKIINLSLGGMDSSATVEAAVAYAVDRGCLVIAAAGNSTIQPTAVEYPAALPSVLAVAATDSNNVPWINSNRGDSVDIAAPGVNIFSTNKDISYYTSSGTSMSTPHVSGLAALLWSLRPDFSPQQIREALLNTAKDAYTTGWDQRTGWGVINAKKAVLMVIQPQLTVQISQETIRVNEEQAAITVTVRDWQGRLVPDGVTVLLETSEGTLSGTSALTVGGQVAVTLTGSRWGRATITARVEDIAQGTAFVDIVPYQVFNPFVVQE